MSVAAGALLAIAAAQHAEAPGIMCLRGVNPYVSAALTDWSRRGGDSAPLVPRAAAPAAPLQLQDAVAGATTCVRFRIRLGDPAYALHPAMLPSWLNPSRCLLGMLTEVDAQALRPCSWRQLLMSLVLCSAKQLPCDEARPIGHVFRPWLIINP